ncbi:MAG: hypothetical protein FD176_2492 [Rhodospirillaceae bacterium]|nr:MAG: hypothetical protein FD176_2492 [Rhodospirillaceae bacterium]TNC93713.1 MAG: hypothetical protein FD119_3793 [Stygiobacter sp.]
MIKRSVLAVVCGLLGGCAATTTENYVPPTEHVVENSVEIKEPFDVVWDRLIRNLSEDFFVINNVERASRIINVSFSSQQAQQFIDCGTSMRTFTNVRGKQDYTYATAGSSAYTTTDRNGIAFNVFRSTKLDGRANVYVAPAGDKATSVSVNAKYVFGVKYNFTNLAGQAAGVQESSIDLTTKEAGTGTHGNPAEIRVRCQATGALERKVLEYAKTHK